MGRDFNQGTEIAKNIFLTINKIQQPKFGFGVNHVAGILIGSESAKILKYKHNQLAEFGALKSDYSLYQVKAWVRELIERGYIEQTGDYPMVKNLAKTTPVLKGLERVNLSEPDPELARKYPPKGESAKITLAMFKAGKTVEEIAQERQLAMTTVISHLAQIFESGEPLDINQFVPSDKQEVIAKEFAKLGTEHLAPVKNTLGPQFSWEDLRWVRAKMTREQTLGKQSLS